MCALYRPLTDGVSPIETPRLVLVPCSLELAEALPDRPRAETLLDARIPRGWPDSELRGLLRLYETWLRDDPSFFGFGPWVAVTRGHRTVVGSAGFVGTPSDNGDLELGFGTASRYRKRGYATEAASALVAWGLGRPGVKRIVAECAPDNLASIRVLEKIGMSQRGRKGGMLLWALGRRD
jgi:ribosomal-protein-alanine N-acetyltransferase